MWLSEEALSGWRYQGPTQRGGQFFYSDLAIETTLTLRKKMGLSIRAFADKIGVNKATIVNWEQGRHTPKGLSLKVLERMAKRASKQN